MLHYEQGQSPHVQAEPRKKGRLALGIISVSVGGLAMLMGGFYGLASESGGFNGGLQTAAVGAGLVGLGTFAIMTSYPDAVITDLPEDGALGLTPTALRGRF
jgi:hypothetical protein